MFDEFISYRRFACHCSYRVMVLVSSWERFGLSIKRLLEVLVRFDKILYDYGIEYIVVGSLADYLLGIPRV